MTSRFFDRRPMGDDGAVLVTAVVVMFVGFVIATVIAASVLFTIQSNSANQSGTQAFIAAESGRDAAVSTLRSAIAANGSVSCVATTGSSPTGEEPRYEFRMRVLNATVTNPNPPRPDGWDSPGLSGTCPTNPDSKWVVIQSTGRGPDGSTATIDSVYPWFHGPATQPAGTLAYFEGKFTATKSTYVGDLVIREAGDYECNNGADSTGTIKGDLWVLNGGLTTTSDCTVTGSVYVRDTITVKNKNFAVGGDLVSVTGAIKLNADGVSIGGEVYAAGNIDTKNGSGIVDKSFRAGLLMANHVTTNWKRINGTAVPITENEPDPVVSPTLSQVFDATSWIELTSTTAWSSPAEPSEPHPSLCSATALKPVLETTGVRAFIDLSSCGSGTITVDLGNVSLARDAMIYVPSSVSMDLQLKGTVSKASGATDPQLFIVHGDGNGGDAKPTCTAGPSAKDKLTVTGSVTVRTMIYSACGIPQTMALTMTGQLYMGNDGLHLNGGTFTCKPMSWKPTLSGLSCGVKGEGGIFDPSNKVTRLDNLAFQAER